MSSLLDFLNVGISAKGQEAAQDTINRILPGWAKDLIPKKQAEKEIVTKTETVTEIKEVLNKRALWIIGGSIAGGALLIMAMRRK